MSLRFLIIDTYYSSFLKSLRDKNLTLEKKSYKEQLRYLLNQFFGTSDFYSYNLKRLGYYADDIVANDEVLQRKWAEENELSVGKSKILERIKTLPLLYKFLGRPDWIQEITLAQIKKAKADVLYMQDLSVLNPETLRKAKKHCKVLVGQIASSMPAKENLELFDLILTSFPHYVEKFRRVGVKSEYFKIAFEPRVLDKIGEQSKKYGAVFVGGFTPQHAQGTKILEKAAKKTKIDIWGRGVEFLSPTSGLRKTYHGEAWALNMYKILAQSKISINRHIDVAENYANNMRLYEATGVGTMLLTDSKKNLGELFRVGKEIVDYNNEDDLTDKIKYFLEHEKEREDIAKAGQKRTLKEHTYSERMKELIRILSKHV